MKQGKFSYTLCKKVLMRLLFPRFEEDGNVIILVHNDLELLSIQNGILEALPTKNKKTIQILQENDGLWECIQIENNWGNISSLTFKKIYN